MRVAIDNKAFMTKFLKTFSAFMNDVCDLPETEVALFV
jgi:hypothetical protein